MVVMLWLTVGFIVIGLGVVVSMKKNMEMRVASILENNEIIESKPISSKPVVWWIVGTSVWGIVSMLLIVLSFLN